MSLSERQRHYLHLMGVDVWLPRHARTEAGPPEQAIPPARGTVQDKDWESLRAEVASCVKCPLHKGRTQTVFGVGNPRAGIMLIGEAPGAEEDRQGEPFVGRAGKLLNAMLAAVGYAREDVFIANILKCRPPKNRDPRPEEVSACEPYLKRQIELVHPRIILALGRVAAQNLLKVDTPIGRMRGRCYEYPEPRIPVVVTYHPAYLLRSPREKRKSWQDLRFAMQIYNENGQ
ncbi:MAG: uracil-DNA glycosylase [Gammaproteobacteria bacterium]|jgi:uracil-DNA glycosylase family 4